MILHFHFEELTALRAGAEALLDREEPSGGGVVMAPSEQRARVEALLPRLDGDVSLSTLAELRTFKSAVDAVVASLRVEMEMLVATTHAADEGAVAAYFDFAHSYAVAHRLEEMESEMEAMIELVTGAPVTPASARTFRFPD